MIYVYDIDDKRREYPKATHYIINDGFITIQNGYKQLGGLRAIDCKRIDIVDDVPGRVDLVDGVDAPPTS
jgi:hypothetical protein